MEPLSQERLSKKELKKVDDYFFSMELSCGSEITDIVEKMLDEIKRMQTVRAERDRYKEAVDFCISTFQGNKMFIKAEQIKLMIKGDKENE